MSLHRLVRTPLPFSDEDYDGYFIRTLEQNGYQDCRHMQERAFKFLTPADLEEMTGHQLSGLLGANPSEALRLGEWILDKNFVYGGHAHMHVCPDCIKQKGYQQAIHGVRYVNTCLEHNRYLISVCSRCKQYLDTRRTSLGACQCGQLIAEMPKEQPDQASFELQSLIQAVLLRKPLDSCTTSLPVEALIALEPNLLLHIIRSIGHAAVSGGVLFFSIDPDNDVVEAAAKTLSNWPYNFIQLLKDYHSGEYYSTSSSRIKELDYFEISGCDAYPNDKVQFLRDVYLEYLTQHWTGKETTRSTRAIRGGGKAQNAEKAALSVFSLVTGTCPKKVKLQLYRNELYSLKLNTQSKPPTLVMMPPYATNNPEYLCVAEALELLGINLTTYMSLHRNGWIVRKHAALSHNRYTRKELEEFKERFSEIALPIESGANSKLATIRHIAHQHLSMDRSQAILLGAVITGDLLTYGKSGRLDEILVPTDAALRVLSNPTATSPNILSRTFRIIDSNMRSLISDHIAI